MVNSSVEIYVCVRVCMTGLYTILWLQQSKGCKWNINMCRFFIPGMNETALHA